MTQVFTVITRSQEIHHSLEISGIIVEEKVKMIGRISPI